MRKKMVAGNWKMNLSLEEAMTLSGELIEKLDHHRRDGSPGKENKLPDVVLFPPFIYLTRIREFFPDTKGVAVGAQNCHHEESGAYTGEVSAPMLSSAGATHVLIGHSERRAQFGEDDQLLARKASRALKNGLTTLFCCGEKLPERESEQHFDVVEKQLQSGVFWMKEEQLSHAVIAYEPVWAIGTGKTASPAQAQEMHLFIRRLVEKTYGKAAAGNIRILYGGSCNANNAGELFAQADVDGGLIGGASLKPRDFFQIILAAAS